MRAFRRSVGERTSGDEGGGDEEGGADAAADDGDDGEFVLVGGPSVRDRARGVGPEGVAAARVAAAQQSPRSWRAGGRRRPRPRLQLHCHAREEGWLLRGGREVFDGRPSLGLDDCHAYPAIAEVLEGYLLGSDIHRRTPGGERLEHGSLDGIQIEGGQRALPAGRAQRQR